MNGHFLADPLAGLGIIQPAHGPSNVGLAVEHGGRRFDLQVERPQHLAPQLRLGRGEHGGLGLVRRVQFGKVRHRLVSIVAVRFDGSVDDREVDRNQTRREPPLGAHVLGIGPKSDV